MQNALAERRARMCPHMSLLFPLSSCPGFRAYRSLGVVERRGELFCNSALRRLFGTLRKGRVFRSVI